MMFDQKQLESFADECVRALDETSIEQLKLHLSYAHHHFEYGMYLRNKFSHLVEMQDDFQREELSREIYIHVLAKLFPALGEDTERIGSLVDQPLFSEVCAHYYLRTGRMAFEDFSVENCRCAVSDGTSLVPNKEMTVAYIVPVAASVWDDAAFTIKEVVAQDVVDTLRETCRGLLLNKDIFLPLELAYYVTGKQPPPETEDVLEKHLRYFLQNHSFNMEDLPTVLFDNRDFVKMAVQANGRVLRYAPAFQNDREIVEAAVQTAPEVIGDVSCILKNDMDIVKTAVANSRDCLIFELPCMKKYRDNDELVKLALTANGANICCVSKRIRDDEEMAAYALCHQGDLYPSVAFASLSARLRDNKALAIMELRSTCPCVSAFSRRLKNDDDIAEMMNANEDTRWLLHYMSKRLQKKYKYTFL